MAGVAVVWLAACGSSGVGTQQASSSLPAPSSESPLCAKARRVVQGNAEFSDLLRTHLGPIVSSVSPTETQRLIETNIPQFATLARQGLPAFLQAIDDLRDALPANLAPDATAVHLFTEDFATKVAAIKNTTDLSAAILAENGPVANAAIEGLGRINAALAQPCGFGVADTNTDPFRSQTGG